MRGEGTVKSFIPHPSSFIPYTLTMSFELLNPWMLLGLAGVALPVIAHLLSKKKYDIVSWGAMQFLELGQETRRRVWLEDLWLLLLRMALIAWLAFALARPWVSASWLGEIGPQPNRDVVLIVDGSYSMAWEATSVTPQQQAVRWIDKFLDDLKPGDTVTLLEAREQVRILIDPPTRDVNRVREVLKNLPPPTSTANLPEGLVSAVKLLSRTNHLRREVVLLTDGQAHGWHADDANVWLRLDDLTKQSSVSPHLWVVNVLDTANELSAPAGSERLNFHVERLQPSRELTVPGFPVRFQTRVRYSGGATAVTRNVHFEVDGQRLADRTVSVSLAPGGEANIEFEHRFEAIGSHLVRTSLDADDLPTDNSSEAVVSVAEALSVLIVDGDPRAEAVQGETFFLRAALAATGNETPWVKPTVVKWADWSPVVPTKTTTDKPSKQQPATNARSAPQSLPPANPNVTEIERNGLDQFAVIVLANVPRLSDSQFAALADFVRRGGGLGIALGNQADKPQLNTQLFALEKGLLNVALSEIEFEPPEQREQGTFIANATLEAPWLQRFRAERGAALTTARFNRWWKVELNDNALNAAAAPKEQPPTEQLDTELVINDRQPALVLARLQTGAPYLIGGQFGRGNVLLLTSPLDADWNSLPTKPDFVPFVHELFFQLASRRGERNVAAGQPLLFPMTIHTTPTAAQKSQPNTTTELVFDGPDGELRSAKISDDKTSPIAMLEDTSLPGVYVLRRKDPSDEKRLANKSRSNVFDKSKPAVAGFGLERELFVVNADRAESDLTPLTDEQVKTIEGDERLHFVRASRDIQIAASNELPRHELWKLLFLAFLALLVFEVLMTRKLVRGGHIAD